jgi:cytochrome P450
MPDSVPIPSAPGPRPLRVVGAALHALRFMRDPIASAGRLFAQYGPVASIVRAPIRVVNPGPGWGTGGLRTATGAGVVVATGADANREVLTQHDRYHSVALSGRLYPTTAEVPERERPLTRMMTGLFHVNGNEHRRHRRLLMPAFHKTRIDAYRDDMVAITSDLVGRYRVGGVRDVHADMTELTLRVATKTLFGEDEGERGVALSRTMQRWLLTMFSPLMALSRADLPGLPYARLLDLTRAIDRETAAIVRAKRARGATGADMLSTLIAARDEDGSALDEDEIVGHAGVIFAAGHDTSTNALAWTLFLLSQHPDVAGDLEDELDGVLRGAPPTVEDLGRLPLLDGVVKESMRVLPPVPLHPRIVAEDSELAGHHLPAGSEVFLSIFHMHHDPAIFPDPTAFSPRRWETIKPSVYEYNPFSAGPRMCIGASFATMEIKIVLAMLLQRFRVELPSRARVDARIAITMAPKDGLRMRIRARTDRVRRRGGVRGRVRTMVRLPA